MSGLSIMGKTINVCNKICSECAFNGSSTNTLYAETERILEDLQIFPCHLYLKSQTGCEFLGTERLNKIKVCRGYVAFVKKYKSYKASKNKVWKYLMDQIQDSELDDILSMNELKANHLALREGVYLGN